MASCWCCASFSCRRASSESSRALPCAAALRRSRSRRRSNSERDALAVFRGPIAGVVYLDRLIGEGEIREPLPTLRRTCHEVLDLLQVAARPFFLEADVLPAGFAIDFLGDVDGRKILLRGHVAHPAAVWRA